MSSEVEENRKELQQLIERVGDASLTKLFNTVISEFEEELQLIHEINEKNEEEIQILTQSSYQKSRKKSLGEPENAVSKEEIDRLHAEIDSEKAKTTKLENNLSQSRADVLVLEEEREKFKVKLQIAETELLRSQMALKNLSEQSLSIGRKSTDANKLQRDAEKKVSYCCVFGTLVYYSKQTTNILFRL